MARLAGFEPATLGFVVLNLENGLYEIEALLTTIFFNAKKKLL